MTYLDRLAARASTSTSDRISAGPRLPSRFEAPVAEGLTAPPGDRAAGLDGASEMRPRAATVRGSTAARTPDTDASVVDPSRAVPSAIRSVGLATRMPDPAEELLHARRGVHATPEAAVSIMAAGADRGGDALNDEGAHEAAEIGAPRVQVASARVSAEPVIASRAEGLAPLVAGDAAAEGSRPDVVTVSIGRIEVRATISGPAPAPTAAPAPPARPTLSLADYLDGRRAAQ